ncbi:hemagglutinin repeat-containing protein, partial [Enterobacter roggenkampii]|uniref:hemagglutinin repeat-containing protein n=2 Tax=Enterobacter roggenkampii TaxID=1812935 RepID=UPI003D6F1B99
MGGSTTSTTEKTEADNLTAAVLAAHAGKNAVENNLMGSARKGKENGTTLTHSETSVSAGDALMIISGRDTNLTGAEVSGESVLADIGRHLTITSEQDTDRYDSSQKNISAGG